MATRNINQIYAELLAAVAANPVLNSKLTSTSDVSIYRNLLYVVAASMGVEEQLYDQFITEVEGMVSSGAPMTAQWLRDQVMKWQYNVSTPEVIQLNPVTFAPYWPTVNPSLRIITRCSVTAGVLNTAIVKVAKSAIPEPLDVDELAALQSFLNNICAPGIIYQAVSTESDKVCTAATVYHKGVYSSVIETNLLNAYNSFLSNVPFDGKFQLTDLEIALKAVQGVNDVVLNAVGARADSTSFASRTKLIDANTEYFKEFKSISGYFTDETTSGSSFTDLLVLVPQ